MTAAEFDRIVRTYRSPFCPGDPLILADVRLLLTHLEAQNGAIRRARTEMQGLVHTLVALLKALGGSIEIPVALVETLDETDQLFVADLDTAHGPCKRFTLAPPKDTTAIGPSLLH